MAIICNRLSNNLAYSWWVHKIAVREAGTDNLLYGGVKSDGDPRIFRWQPGDTEPADIENHILYDAQEADDHNGISILSQENKDLLVFWQRHGKSQFINYWRAPEGTFNFGTKKTITFPNNVTYCQQLVDGDKIILICRVGSSGWQYVISEDWGATWSEPAPFFDGSAFGGQIYVNTMAFENDPTKFHITAYGHPTSSPLRDVCYFEFDIVTGDFTAGGNVVANLYSSSNMPLTPGAGELVWTPNPNVAGEKVRMLDVGDKYGNPAVLLAKWNDNTQIPQYYVAWRDNGVWKNFKYQSSGGVFDDGGGRKYTYGMCFDRNNENKLYMIAKEDGTRYRIKRYDVAADFTISNEAILGDTTTQLARPYAPHGREGVIYQVLETYNGFTDYLIELGYRK